MHSIDQHWSCTSINEINLLLKKKIEIKFETVAVSKYSIYFKSLQETLQFYNIRLILFFVYVKARKILMSFDYRLQKYDDATYLRWSLTAFFCFIELKNHELMPTQTIINQTE